MITRIDTDDIYIGKYIKPMDIPVCKTHNFNYVFICTLYNLHYTHCTLHNMHPTLYNVHCVKYSVHSTLYIMYTSSIFYVIQYLPI